MDKKVFIKDNLYDFLNQIESEKNRSASKFLLDYLVDKKDFDSKPAASKFHHVFVGGLVQHTCEVIEHALYLNTYLGEPYCVDDLILAGFLHDVGKVFVYFERKTGSFGLNKTVISQESIALHLACRFGLVLNYNVISAIEFAHGGWSIFAKDWALEPLPISCILHAADQFSSFFGKGGIVDLKKEKGVPLFEVI